MGKKVLAATAALSLLGLLGYDLGTFSSAHKKRQQGIDDSAMVMQEPRMGLVKAYFYEWIRRTLGQDSLKYDFTEASRRDLAERIFSIKEGDCSNQNISELVALMGSERDRGILGASINALGRMSCRESGNALYSVVRNGPEGLRSAYGMYYDAAKKLAEKSPERAANAVIRFQESGIRNSSYAHSIYDDVRKILVDIGTENALVYFIRKNDAKGVYEFLQRGDRQLVKKHGSQVISVLFKGIENSCVVDGNVPHYASDYAKAIRELDTTPGNGRSESLAGELGDWRHPGGCKFGNIRRELRGQ